MRTCVMANGKDINDRFIEDMSKGRVHGLI